MKRVQHIRHATVAANAFIGLEGEITADTTAKELRYHDGSTPGGIAAARRDLANVADATTSAAGKMSAADKTKLDGIATGAQVNTVTGVHGRTGAVVSANGDYNAGQITNTPAGGIAAVTVQAALDELDAEKLALAGGTMSGALILADQELSRGLVFDMAGKIVTNATPGAALALDYTAGIVFHITLDDDTVFSFTNPPATGQYGAFLLHLYQDGTGNRVPSWPAAVDWDEGTAPTIPGTASAFVASLLFETRDAGTTWFGTLVGGGYA